MRDPDRAWSSGSRDIEIEANLDAYPYAPPGGYICCECEGVHYFDEDGIGRTLDMDIEIDGHLYCEEVHLCPACAMDESLRIAQEEEVA